MKLNLNDIAKSIDAAAYTATPVDQITLSNNLTLTDAYKIQELSIDERIRRGEKLVGYKLGFTSKAKMEQMGVHELIWGRLTNEMDYTSKDKLDFDKFIHPRIEPEIAFLLKEDIETELNISNVYNYIEAVAPALEIIDSRYKNFKFSLEDVVADNCSSSAFVLGKWLDPKTRISETSIRISVGINEKVSGISNAILGSPILSFIEISKISKKYNFPLKKGMIVLAGAATAAQYFNKNEVVLASFEHLGDIRFN